MLTNTFIDGEFKDKDKQNSLVVLSQVNWQIKNPSKVNETKKSIARLKTMLGVKKNA